LVMQKLAAPGEKNAELSDEHENQQTGFY